MASWSWRLQRPYWRILCALRRGLTALARDEFERHPSFDHARFEYYCLKLRQRRMLEIGLRGPRGDLLIAISHRMSFEIGSQPLPTDSVKVSGFAYLRGTERGAVLASPEAACEIVLADPRTAQWLHGLMCEHTDDDPDAVERAALIDMLWRLSFLERLDVPESEARPVLGVP